MCARECLEISIDYCTKIERGASGSKIEQLVIGELEYCVFDVVQNVSARLPFNFITQLYVLAISLYGLPVFVGTEDQFTQWERVREV